MVTNVADASANIGTGARKNLLLTIFLYTIKLSILNMEHFMDEKKVLQKLIEHDEKLNRIEEKLDKLVMKDDFNNKSDKMMVILKRLDQERVFTTEWVRRVESDVERNKQEIKQLKQHLGIT